jgi:hypothetical protein
VQAGEHGARYRARARSVQGGLEGLVRQYACASIPSEGKTVGGIPVACRTVLRSVLGIKRLIRQKNYIDTRPDGALTGHSL